jgi:hypothetical protein
VTAPFQLVSTTCTSSLAAGSSCEVAVQFAPTVAGVANGQLSVQTSAGATAASLSGTGTVQAILQYARDPINLGTAQLGGPPLTHLLALANTGNAALRVNSITIGSPFSVSHDCPPILPAGASCTAEVRLDPRAVGAFGGQLAISSEAAGASSTIAVSALVQALPEPLIVTQPASIGFGERSAGSQSGNQRITIRNDGGVLGTINLGVGGLGFLITQTSCGATLEPQASCFADVVFAPNAFGTQRGSFIVTSNAPGSPHVVSLSGVGCRPFIGRANRSGSVGTNCAP